MDKCIQYEILYPLDANGNPYQRVSCILCEEGYIIKQPAPLSEIQFQTCIRVCPENKLFYKTYNIVDPLLDMVIYQGRICTDEVSNCYVMAPRSTNYYTTSFPFRGQ